MISLPLVFYNLIKMRFSIAPIRMVAVVPDPIYDFFGNIRPTDMAAVLAPNKQGNMAVFPMIWGFTHEATEKPIVNCRVESADQKAMWKDSWYRRRCIIPASWYYEWGVPPSEVGFRNANEQCKQKQSLIICGD